MREPMRASPIEEARVKKILQQEGYGYVQPKINGMRVVAKGGLPKSRSMKTYNNKLLNKMCQAIEEYYYDFWLDGEIVVGHVAPGNEDFRATSSLRAEDFESNFTFWIFDIANYSVEPYEKRKKVLFDVLFNHKDYGPGGAVHMIPVGNGYEARVKLLPTYRVESWEDICMYEERFVNLGAEGLIFRSKDGLYKYGKATPAQGWLLKMKRWTDNEFKIVGWNPMYRNLNLPTINEVGRQTRSTHKDGKIADELLGNLICEMNNPIKGLLNFEVGSGFDMDTRKQLWDLAQKGELIGKWAKTKYLDFWTSGYDRPQSAVFLELRDPRDLPPDHPANKGK